MSRPPLRKPATPVRRPPPAAFRCPACDEALRVRGDAVGSAFECPACGAGLLIGRDDDRELTVRPMGGTTERPAPRWPFFLAAFGVACAATAGWLVLRSGPAADPAERSEEPAKIIAADPPPVAPPAASDRPPAEPQPEPPPMAVDVAPAPLPPPEPQPTAPTVTLEPYEPDPVRPPATAPRPTADLAVRRIERRLDATLSSYQMPAARPLREAIADLEDLLRERITIEARAETPVRLDLPGPLTVRTALEELAAAAGLRAEIDADGVRLVPAAPPASPSP
ncbi:hypothetical protein [Alienimonas californiensis]|uniref:Uncharacterized protein n=1 Tax=Alienimonas californiensis TaxID=2527989 RepID=A0A517PBW3_9PLAN|nr:hypothetical protein [Alienimonas californiensis]QDT16873.1 hypothetical protein CA12_29810 [Alienimonas californiensis]